MGMWGIRVGMMGIRVEMRVMWGIKGKNAGNHGANAGNKLKWKIKKVYKVQFSFLPEIKKKKQKAKLELSQNVNICFMKWETKPCYQGLMLRLVTMIQSSGIIWMEYGRVEHLYWSCFSDSRVNFLLMKRCTLHRVTVSQGTSN